MCEALTPQEEMAISEGIYQCTTCMGECDFAEVFHTKISLLLDEEETLNDLNQVRQLEGTIHRSNGTPGETIKQCLREY